MKQTQSVPKVPTAAITVKKSRLKSYSINSGNKAYYLEKGQEFEIELYNPTTKRVLAKIEINGVEISQGGLILRPAERVFLDRYLDVAKKFMFDTYEVENTKINIEAIKDNGDLVVRFYNEIEIYSKHSPIFLYDYPNLVNQQNTNLSNNFSRFSKKISYTENVCGSLNLFNASIPEASFSYSSDDVKSIETGRVEKGSASDQVIVSGYGDFSNYPFITVSYKLLPISQKITTTEELNVRRYCTNCGSKITKTQNFCGNCGNKL